MHSAKITDTYLLSRIYSKAISWLSLVASVALLFSCQLASASGDKDSATPEIDGQAFINEADGNVFKREVIELVNYGLGKTQPVEDSMKLKELSQIGTGPESRCEICWTSIKARISDETVIQIQPNKRIVYLAKGELLIRQQTNSPGKLTIWSPYMKATLKGTTAIMQHTSNITRFALLEGSAEIRSLMDEAIIALRPGVVYEILTPFTDPYETTEPKQTQDDAIRQFWQPFDSQWQVKPPPHPSSGSTEWSLENLNIKEPKYKLANSELPPLDLFKTSKSLSRISILDCGQINLHPLLTKFDQRLDSEKLIQSTFLSLPPICHPAANPTVEKAMAKRAQLLGKAVQIEMGPSRVKFTVGKELGYGYSMPSFIASDNNNPDSSGSSEIKEKKTYKEPPPGNYTVAQIESYIKRLSQAYYLSLKEAEKFQKETEFKYDAMIKQLEVESQQGISSSVQEARKSKIEEWKDRQKPFLEEIMEKSDKLKFHLDFWKRQQKMKNNTN